MPSRLCIAPARSLAAGLLVSFLSVTLVFVTPASADTASMSFTDAAGHVDPVAGVGRTLAIVGNAAVPEHFYIKHRAAGGAPCAPSWASDSGDDRIEGFAGDSVDTDVNGNFTLSLTGTWSTAGTELFCIWLAGSGSASSVPISQVVTFRRPTGTISATVDPAQVQAGQSATVTIIGSSESPEQVWGTVRPAGTPCGVSYDADSGHSLISGQNVNGTFSLQATTTQTAPGTYTICLWLADSSSSGSPIAGPQNASFVVPAPPPACVVPVVRAGSPAAVLMASLTAAHCALGHRSYAASRSYPRGTLLKLRTAPGTTLPSNAAVDVVISTGRPCRVPALRPGTRLSTGKARILAAGCTIGKVTFLRSRAHRRGIVLAYGPAPGTRLKPRAAIAIVVSAGPGRHR